MDLIRNMISDLTEFINFFKMKYKYDQRGVLKRYRLKFGLNKKLTEDVWCDLFVEKSAYNYCAKLLLIKYWEDNGKISSKINKDGLLKWNNLVTNIENYYSTLYKISEIDMMECQEMKDIFKESDYDIFEIDDELAGFAIGKLKEYSFKGYKYDLLFNIFNRFYVDEKSSGVNLQYFYKPAKAIDYVLTLKSNEEKLG
ncbi:MAG: hypothetical protein FH761_16090 [Firmicutes bacterium]|nr:hypothetical protein [Bacillota bacterium]